MKLSHSLVLAAFIGSSLGLIISLCIGISLSNALIGALSSFGLFSITFIPVVIYCEWKEKNDRISQGNVS